MKNIISLILILSNLFVTAQTLVPFLKKNSKYIFVNPTDMKQIIPMEFDIRPDLFILDFAIVTKDKKNFFKNTLIDKKGNEYCSNFESVISYNNGIAIVRQNNKYGLANLDGKLIVEPKYIELRYLSENLYYAKIDIRGNVDLIDGTGKIKESYNSLTFINDEQMEFNYGGKYGLIDVMGNVIIPPIFKDYFESPFSCGLVKVKYDGKYGYKNKKDELIIPYNYKKATDFTENLAIVVNNESSSLIDTTGKIIFSQKYLYGGEFSEGFYRLNNDNTFFIDNKNKVKLIMDDGYGNDNLVDKFKPLSIDESILVLLPKGYMSGIGEGGAFGTDDGFHEGLLGIMFQKKLDDFNYPKACAFINPKGSYVISVKDYEFYRGFINGFAILRTQKGAEFFIDKKGKEYLEK